jgi:hypothetical protein
MPAPSAIASTNSALFMVSGFKMFFQLCQIYRCELNGGKGYRTFRGNSLINLG